MKKYKLVVEAKYRTFVEKRSDNKEYLTSRAVKLSIKYPYSKHYVVSANTKI